MFKISQKKKKRPPISHLKKFFCFCGRMGIADSSWPAPQVAAMGAEQQLPLVDPASPILPAPYSLLSPTQHALLIYISCLAPADSLSMTKFTYT